jgi:hypothetical protein
MPRDRSDFRRPLVRDTDERMAFCDMEAESNGELVPTIGSIGANTRVRGNSKTRFINDFLF